MSNAGIPGESPYSTPGRATTKVDPTCPTKDEHATPHAVEDGTFPVVTELARVQGIAVLLWTLASSATCHRQPRAV